MDIEERIQSYYKWKDNPQRCKCEQCERVVSFIENYVAVRDGAPFSPKMLKGLAKYECDAFIELICLRSI